MSNAPSKKASRPIQLDWDGGDVCITPEDQDRFVTASQWAVSACQNQLAVERFVQRYQSEFLGALRRWCEEHQRQVLACFVAYPPASVNRVFVISSAERYDFELSDPITDLETTLAEKGWSSDVLQVPSGSPESLSSYFDPGESIQVYGNGSRALGQSDA